MNSLEISWVTCRNHSSLQLAFPRNSQLLREAMLMISSKHYLPLQYQLMAVGNPLQVQSSSLDTSLWVWMHFWLVIIVPETPPCSLPSPLQARPCSCLLITAHLPLIRGRLYKWGLGGKGTFTSINFSSIFIATKNL